MAGVEPKYTHDEALRFMGFGKFQYLVLLYAGMGWASEAMEMMLLSFVGPAVQDKWDLTSQQDNLITSVVFAGMVLGAYSWGFVSDRYGRRKGFLVTATITSAAGLWSAFAPNYTTLIIARCLVGIGVGGGHVFLSWFLEFIPAPNRGMWMVILSAFWTVGAISEAGLAWIVMPRWGWRWLLGLSALPSFVLLIFYTMTPESPRYLCLKGKKNDALKILEKMAMLNGKELPPGVLASDHEIGLYGTSLPQEGAHSLSIGETVPAHPPSSNWKDSDMSVFRSLLTLLSPKLIRSTLLLWIVFFGNAFSYYGLVLLANELNKKNECNPTAVHSKNSGDVNYKGVFITSFAEFPGLVLSAIIVDKLGRKLSMAGMFFLACIVMLPLVVHQAVGVSTALLFGARIFITGTTSIAYIYAPEIYPTTVRSTGVGAASSMGRVGGMICPLVTVSMVQGCHQMAAVVLFVGVILVSGIGVLLLKIETKGCQLSDGVSNTTNEKVSAIDEEEPTV